MSLLTIIIPTHNRKPVLLETLERLPARQNDFEVLVVDDGSTDGTSAAVAAIADRLPYPLRLHTQAQSGPAAARNRALADARGEISLFLGDDTRPLGDMLDCHRRFHERFPDEHEALLGRVEWAREPPPTELMAWLEDSGIQFGFGILERQMGRDRRVPGRFFYTSNVSAKTAFLRRHNGFDEEFRAAACEDTEFGERLEAAGMRLAYDSDAVVEHEHPTDLTRAVGRMKVVGRSWAEFADRGGHVEAPRRPGLRHRTGAWLLTALYALPVDSPRVRRETWRFLCHEAHREGFWAIEAPAERRLRHGERLLRIASRDSRAQMP